MIHTISALVFLFLTASSQGQQTTTLDDFADPSGWSPVTSDGVNLTIRPAQGRDGGAMRLDFDFTKGSGYCIARRKFDIPLPANYRITFDIRADAGTPVNNLEFKLIDHTGDNVWWHNRRAFEFPTSWTTLVDRTRHISFAWGPAGADKPIERLGAIEFAIASATGGKGSIYIDNLTIQELPPPSSGPVAPPLVLASSARAALPDTLPDDAIVNWSPDPNDAKPSFTLDFETLREFAGLTLAWDDTAAAPDYDIQTSDNTFQWVTIATSREALGGRHDLPLPESEARYLRVALRSPAQPADTLRSIRVRDIAFNASPSAMFRAIASELPRGRLPRWATGEQSFWTVIGADAHRREGLINEEGQVETDKTSFSLEPFLLADNRLLTWADATATHSLAESALPIPSVHLNYETARVTLDITAFAPGDADASHLETRYRVTNRAGQKRTITLAVAARPFQVLPPWQDLNISGGVARIRTIRADGNGLIINEDQRFTADRVPASLGVTTFARGDITRFLENGTTPPTRKLSDDAGLASGVLTFPLDLEPGASAEVRVATTFKGDLGTPSFSSDTLADTTTYWRSTLDRVRYELPPAAQRHLNAYRSTLAYILINRDGPSIQPGSRTYERTWIRDGSLTSTALLYAGRADAARDLINWYADFQYDNGKIPCVVDTRGPDPVPENDSHGQYLYAVATYDRFQLDDKFLTKHWPHVRAAVGYIEFLRNQRLTDEYAKGPRSEQAKLGLMPESISHEGYSAKPMHSHWDNFFTLRGLIDAVYIADRLDQSEEAARFAVLRDSFGASLTASLNMSLEDKKLAYIPGCVELGDFDPTSTSSGIFPGHLEAFIPATPLRNTFDLYWNCFEERRQSQRSWFDYTPYEIRNATSFLMLGQPQRAHALLTYFLDNRVPQAWNAWPEITYRETRLARFAGDIPHTWVGSDYVKCFRNLFAYEKDDTLIVGAGLPREWIESAKGARVNALTTYFGVCDITFTGTADQTTVSIRGLRQPPAGGILIHPGFGVTVASAVNADAAALPVENNAVRITSLPATITFTHPRQP